LELREIAGRVGCEITKIYKEHGISGAILAGSSFRDLVSRCCTQVTSFRRRAGL
jgi:hypothetical protein